jgi:hypothetical protein
VIDLTTPSGILRAEFNGFKPSTGWRWLIGGALGMVVACVLFKHLVEIGNNADHVHSFLLSGVMIFVGWSSIAWGGILLIASSTFQIYPNGFRYFKRNRLQAEYLWAEVVSADLVTSNELTGKFIINITDRIAHSIHDAIATRQIEGWILELRTSDGKVFRFTRVFFADYKGLLASISAALSDAWEGEFTEVLRTGGSVQFSNVLLTKDGIANNREMLRWEEIGCIETPLEGFSVIIKKRDPKRQTLRKFVQVAPGLDSPLLVKLIKKYTVVIACP